MVVNKGYFKHFISIFLEIFLFSDLAGWEDDTGEPAEEPPAGEAGDGGEGGRGEAHHHVGQGHVAHKQVDPRVKAGGPQKEINVFQSRVMK